MGAFSFHREMYDEERLKPLKSYRYRGVDKSFISRYVLSHYWNWVITLCPLTIAPNLITLIGLGFMVLALSVAVIYTPDYIGPGPSWIYFFFALCLWIYSTLDNIDGKQARRTNTSSPLGELFDHGCDALNCTIGGLVQVAALGVGSSFYSMLVLGITLWAFYLPTWEEYHTGVLYLGYINGPTEGILAAISLMILSGIYGPEIWTKTFGEQFPSLSVGTWLENISICHVAIVLFFSIFFAFYIPVCLFGVYQECQKRGKSFPKALSQLIPMVMVSIASIFWLWCPFSRIRQEHFTLFCLSFGIAFGKMATKIIYAHLTKRHFPSITGLMTPLFLGCLLANLPLIIPKMRPFFLGNIEKYYLWGWFIFCLIGYMNWSYRVIDSFCKYLDINCLTIKSSIRSPIDRPVYPQKAT